jgi:hypothetical protein
MIVIGVVAEESGSDSDEGSDEGPAVARKPKTLSKKEQRRIAKGAVATPSAAAIAAAAEEEAEPKIKLTAVPMERKGGRKMKAAIILDDLLPTGGGAPTADISQLRISDDSAVGADDWSSAPARRK